MAYEDNAWQYNERTIDATSVIHFLLLGGKRLESVKHLCMHAKCVQGSTKIKRNYISLQDQFSRLHHAAISDLYLELYIILQFHQSCL